MKKVFVLINCECKSSWSLFHILPPISFFFKFLVSSLFFRKGKETARTPLLGLPKTCWSPCGIFDSVSISLLALRLSTFQRRYMRGTKFWRCFSFRVYTFSQRGFHSFLPDSKLLCVFRKISRVQVNLKIFMLKDP